jgi:putative flippase GtrA
MRIPLISSNMVRFILTGGTSAVLNALSRILFSLVFTYEQAIVLAYFVGMITAYVLARIFVFPRSGRSAPQEFLRFALVNIVSLTQVWAVSVGLAHHVFPAIGLTWQPELAAHVIGLASITVTSYYLHKHFSFRTKRDAV